MAQTQTTDWSAFEPAGEQPQADEWSQFEESAPETTFGQKALAFGEAALGAGVQTAGGIAGAGIGGTLATGTTGPGVGTFVGGLAGFLGGSTVGGKAREELGLQTPEQMPPELRPAAYAGEVIGGNLLTAALPQLAAFRGLTFGKTPSLLPESQISKFVNELITTAKEAPKQYWMTELVPTAVSATASGVVSKIAPENQGLRQATEILAPLPGVILIQSAKTAMTTAKRAISTFTPAGRQNDAANLLQTVLNATGENPEVMVRVLKEFKQQYPDLDLTPSQMTGSKTLAVLEDHIAEFSGKFSAEAEQKARDGLDAIRVQIGLLTRTGDPAALQAAADLKVQYFRGLIESRVSEARRIAYEAVEGISKDTPQTRVELSKAARDALDQSIKEVRAAENELWGLVDKELSSGYMNLEQTLKKFRAEIPAEIQAKEGLPDYIDKFLKRISKVKAGEESSPDVFGVFQNKPSPASAPGTTVGEMMAFRSQLLDDARKASTAGDFNKARIFNDLAESIFDDIDLAFKQAGSEAYDNARLFSKELNDVFTRSFAGKATGQGKYGNRIAPELLLSKALATGKEASALYLQELEEATRFLVNQGLGNEQAVGVMLDAQERFFRLAASSMTDKNGRISEAAVHKFMQAPGNALLLDRFPEVKTALETARTTESARIAMETLAKKQVGIINKQKIVTSLIKKDPVESAGKALVSPNQEKELLDLVKAAKMAISGRPLADSQGVMQGFTASVLDAAIRKSTVNVREAGQMTRTLDPNLFRSFLFEPAIAGKKAPIEILLENGFIDKAQVTNIEKWLKVASNIQASVLGGGTQVEIPRNIGDEVIELTASVLGSKGAGILTKTAGGSNASIIIHGAGSRFMKNIVRKMPVQRTREVLMTAMSDPDALEMLLKKTKNPAELAKKYRNIHAWFVTQGLYDITESADDLMNQYGPNAPIQPEGEQQ